MIMIADSGNIQKKKPLLPCLGRVSIRHSCSNRPLGKGTFILERLSTRAEEAFDKYLPRGDDGCGSFVKGRELDRLEFSEVTKMLGLQTLARVVSPPRSKNHIYPSEKGVG